MKQLILISIALLAISGCASSATADRLTALENQLSGVSSTADQALEMARDASSAASGSASDISDAQRMARQAMDTATETAERLSRMESECCGGK
ncbi:MAG: hypothetical protein V2I41_06100 [Pseudomonadales bacterium]|jgi:biopolymer transport protein ExbB/TolQ|nr:hypothetical protein [Pseudomonadales bacterium]